VTPAAGGVGLRLRSLAEQTFEALRSLSLDGAGVTREAFGPAETAAQEVIAQLARSHGLPVERDRVGNLVVTLTGDDPAAPCVITGSHLDSVPRGGNYDGAAGVVAGLLAMIALRDRGLVPPRTVKLVALRGEESCWYGKSWIGSHALLGRLRPADLDRGRFDSGRPLRESLVEVGADLPAIERGEVLLDPAVIAGFVEVHIEQGPVLEAEGLPLGVVTAIFGNLRHMRVVCRGEAAHSGATPRHLRHDAVVAIADLVMRMDAHWQRWLEAGREVLITHGMLGTDPREHAISRVPGEAHFSVEIRAASDADLHAFHALLREEMSAVAAARSVTFELDEAIVNPAAPMDERWQARLAEICAEMNLPHRHLPSGAGHDASVFAAAGVPTSMLFIRNAHGSHNPHEHMAIDDFLLATEVLAQALVRPVTAG